MALPRRCAASLRLAERAFHDLAVYDLRSETIEKKKAVPASHRLAAHLSGIAIAKLRGAAQSLNCDWRHARDSFPDAGFLDSRLICKAWL